MRKRTKAASARTMEDDDDDDGGLFGVDLDDDDDDDASGMRNRTRAASARTTEDNDDDNASPVGDQPIGMRKRTRAASARTMEDDDDDANSDDASSDDFSVCMRKSRTKARSATMEDDDDDASPVGDLEIVGLDMSNNGRSCTQHSICGKHVAVNDILRLVSCVVTTHGNEEEAVKLVKLADGADSCTVGFVPRVFAKSPKVKANLKKFVQVVELYSDSPNSHKRRLSHQNHGMASVVFLDSIPIAE
jgi:hypothetical protein